MFGLDGTASKEDPLWGAEGGSSHADTHLLSDSGDTS